MRGAGKRRMTRKLIHVAFDFPLEIEQGKHGLVYVTEPFDSRPPDCRRKRRGSASQSARRAGQTGNDAAGGPGAERAGARGGGRVLARRADDEAIRRGTMRMWSEIKHRFGYVN